MEPDSEGRTVHPAGRAMTFPITLSETAAKRLRKLPKGMRVQVASGLRALAEDPLRPRPNVDIRVIEGTNPQKYWLRVGDGRVVYAVLQDGLKVIEVFVRGQD